MHPNREPPHQWVRFPPLDWPETGISTPPDPDAPTFPGPGPGMTLTGTRGQPITPFQIPATATGGPITSYGASNLPAGLTVDTTTGIISGTPTVTVTNRRITVSATNAEGTTRGTLLVTISAPGTGPTPTLPWANDLTFNLPGSLVVIDGATPTTGRFPITTLTGWDPAMAADLNDNALYMGPNAPATPAAQAVRLFATFTPPGTEVEVDFDKFGMGTSATNKITRWSFDSTPPASIVVYGSNSTTNAIQFRLSKA